MLVILAFARFGLPGAQQSSSLPTGSEEQLSRIISQATSDGRREWDAHHYALALLSYERAQQAAHQSGDADSEARAWISICGCETFLNQFPKAIQACDSSHQLATRVGNKTWAGVAAFNLGDIYRELGEYNLAEKESRQALELLADNPHKGYIVETLISLEDLLIEQGKFSEGLAFSDRGIKIAREAKLPDEEAFLWDIRGFALMKANRLGDAEDALKRGQAIRVDGKQNAWFALILGHRSELELKIGDYQEALRLNDLAFQSRNANFSAVPAYYFVHVRGLILRALNRNAEALTQLRKAIDLANSWRESAVPGDNTNTQTVVYLNEVYQDFAQLAAELSLQHNDQNLSRQAFEALAQNRDASLREQLAASLVRNPNFSNRYFQLLSELQTAQARVTLGGSSAQDKAKLQAIRSELSELEDESLSFSKKSEKKSPQNSLIGIQSELDRAEVLLSFSLGKSASFLWAITGTSVQLYKLPKQSDIENMAQRFADSVKSDRTDNSINTALSHALFGQLSSTVWQKSDWLLAEDSLVAGRIPYAALQDVSTRTGETLVAHHNLRILPSELLLSLPRSPKPQQRFVGVADPIYNLADSRRLRDVHLVSTRNSQTTASLGRLVGSSREIRSAAQLSGMPKTQILLGSEANETELRKALDQPPEILHFAVHVVSPEGKPQEAAIALSLTRDNVPQLLTRESVAAFRVPGSLVVLSGCDSGQGKALPSAGLIGLSRAWLLAGAAAVVVSSWPIQDDSGEFFSAFYRHLQTAVAGPLAQRAATALQHAQLDMQRSSGYRTSGSFWAAYSILSKE